MGKYPGVLTQGNFQANKRKSENQKLKTAVIQANLGFLTDLLADQGSLEADLTGFD